MTGSRPRSPSPSSSATRIPIYARLRAEAPVAWVPAVEMWLATTWDAALRVASEPELFAADMPGSPIDRSFGSPTILTCDGEPHKELRGSIDPKYRPHAVDEYIEELVGPIVAEHLDALAGRDEADLMEDLFEPVSVLSLGAVLGLGDVDADTLRALVRGARRRRDQLRARPRQAGAQRRGLRRDRRAPRRRCSTGSSASPTTRRSRT